MTVELDAYEPGADVARTQDEGVCAWSVTLP